MLTSIDLNYLMQVLLPPLLRQPTLKALLTALQSQVVFLQSDLYDFFDLVRYELSINGQVINLEHILNDKFDNVNREIYISDGTENPLVYLFNNSEPNEDLIIANTSEVAIPPVYLYNHIELEIEVDFIVNVPSTITLDENLLKSIVNKYRCASKRFTIEYFFIFKFYK